MDNLFVNLVTVGVSILGAAMICGLTFGRLQGKVEGVITRLNRIETEHTDVVKGMAAVDATVKGASTLLLHMNERMDVMVCKEDLNRLALRIDQMLTTKQNRE